MELLSESFQSSSDVGYELTPTEEKVIRLLASGLQQKEISFQLDISVNTLKTHLRSAYRKLGVHNEAAAVARFLLAEKCRG